SPLRGAVRGGFSEGALEFEGVVSLFLNRFFCVPGRKETQRQASQGLLAELFKYINPKIGSSTAFCFNDMPSVAAKSCIPQLSAYAGRLLAARGAVAEKMFSLYTENFPAWIPPLCFRKD